MEVTIRGGPGVLTVKMIFLNEPGSFCVRRSCSKPHTDPERQIGQAGQLVVIR